MHQHILASFQTVSPKSISSYKKISLIDTPFNRFEIILKDLK